MNAIQLRTVVVGAVLGLLFVLLALAIATQVELALGALLLILIVIAWFVRSITKRRRQAAKGGGDSRSKDGEFVDYEDVVENCTNPVAKSPV